MSASLLLENSAREREASDFGATFTHGAGTTVYPCSLGAMKTGARLTPGGFSSMRETVIIVRKSAVGAITFSPGQTITVTDKRGTVRALKIAPEGVEDLVYLWQLTGEAVAQTK